MPVSGASADGQQHEFMFDIAFGKMSECNVVNMIRFYNPNDEWNGHNLARLFDVLPDGTIAPRKPPGRKFRLGLQQMAAMMQPAARREAPPSQPPSPSVITN